MKNVPLIFLGIGLCVCLSASPQVQRQRAVKPAPAVKVEGKVDQFLKVVQNAISFAEVRTAFDRAGFTQNELDELKRKVESSSSIREKIEQLQKQDLEASNSRIEESQRAAAAHIATLKTQLVEKRLKDSRTGDYRIGQDLAKSLKTKQALTADPNVVCAADMPTIKKIYGPVTPGSEFCIEGVGLGPAPGSIDLMTGGKVFRARINSWNQCSVYAVVSEDIEGLKADRAAAVALETNSGKKASVTVAFEPLIEVRMEKETDLELGAWLFSGRSHDWELFKYDLKNDWYYCETRIEYYIRRGGHAEVTSEPQKFVPNINAKVIVHGGTGPTDWIHIAVYQYIAGPKGLPHR
jgi:FtsZ-binding cell division protein ZapB